MTYRNPDKLLRFAEVRDRTGLSRTTIYRKIAAGTFPRSVPISEQLVAWYQADIDAWTANPSAWGRRLEGPVNSLGAN